MRALLATMFVVLIGATTAQAATPPNTYDQAVNPSPYSQRGSVLREADSSQGLARDGVASPNTTDLFIVTGEGHQVTATWRSTERSHFHCWLTREQGQRLGKTSKPQVGLARLPCTPPKTYDGLPPGNYKLHVRAISTETGLRDPTPAVGAFRIAP